MKHPARVALALLLALSARAAIAQRPKIDIEALLALPHSTLASDYGSPLLSHGGTTFEGGVNVHWSECFSTLASVSSSEGALYLRGVPGIVRYAPFAVDVVPLMVIGQWHFLGMKGVDPYVGVGAAWQFVSNGRLLSGSFPEVAGASFDDQIAFVANAGVRFRLFGPVGLLLDAKYIPTNLDAILSFDDGRSDLPIDVRADQIIPAIGISFRF